MCIKYNPIIHGVNRFSRRSQKLSRLEKCTAMPLINLWHRSTCFWDRQIDFGVAIEINGIARMMWRHPLSAISLIRYYDCNSITPILVTVLSTNRPPSFSTPRQFFCGEGVEKEGRQRGDLNRDFALF